MREIDKVFLALFKNIRIVQDENGGYVCYSNLECRPVTNKEVVGLVKQYQDLLIEKLICENNKEDKMA